MKRFTGYWTTPAIFLVMVFLLARTFAIAQEAMHTNQQRFTVDEGLPQNFISGMAQDDDGFMWFSTMDGLCRYDGRSFRIFRHRADDTSTIFSNAIYNVLCPGNNKLMLFYDGLPVENFDMRTFAVSRNNVRINMATLGHALWRIASVNNNGPDWLFIMKNYRGVGWYHTASARVHFASKANGGLEQDTVTAMVQSPEGKLYLVSGDGVQVIDPSKNKLNFLRFATTVKKIPSSLQPNDFYRPYSIVYLPGEKLALYEENAILLLDVQNKTVSRYPVPPPTGVSTETVIPVLKVDKKGRVYFGNRGRIFRLDRDNQIKLLWENKLAPHLTISSYFIDRSDVLWVSVSAQGIMKIDLAALSFQTFRYRDHSNFAADIVQQAGAEPASLPDYWKGSPASYHLRQGWDSRGNRYVCYNNDYRNEVFQLNQKGLRPFKHLPAWGNYSALVVMPDDAVWVYDQVKSAWYNWETPESVPRLIQMPANSMQNKEIADAKYIGGFLWVSTYAHGLLQFKDSLLVAKFTGPVPVKNMPRDLTEICPDPWDSNRFWIGTRGGGMVLWDVSRGLQKVFTTDDGLPNNTVYCILPDKLGRIWGSTNKGIFCFNPKTQKVLLVFEKSDGLQGNEFNRAHKFLFADGRMAFGGIDGYTIFDPARFSQDKTIGIVPLQLTSLQINNELQEFGKGNRFISEPLSLLQQIELPYNKNNLRLEFAALVFNQPQKTRYRYMLSGADNTWTENGSNNTASFAALPPGNYVLRLNATDGKGQWSTVVRELKITIHPPFWATWWAYILYVLAAVALARWYFIYHAKRIRIEQSLAFEKKEGLRWKELDEVKDRFFSNVTHEFRTPLTLIITPLEKLKADPTLPPSVVQTITGVEKNSRQLLQLINEFLDFSKLNDGRMPVKLSSGELSLFLTGCIQSFETAANEKGIELSFACEGVKGFYWFDEEKWEKIIRNLLSNALKFTPSKGKITVLIRAVGDVKIRIEVKDNGPGIPLQEQHKIFERFYQSDSSSIRKYGGTGIGLSLVKELVELMQGQINVDSIQGSHTRFIVEIPVKKAAPGQSTLNANGKGLKQTFLPTNGVVPMILIVEDNDELRQFLAESIRGEYMVVTAADGAQAWPMILDELPDIIISDVMMPGRDGFDLCQMCKSDLRTAHIGFILLTSKSAHESRMQGLESGADEYITKPFHLDELEQRLANLLHLQQKQRERRRTELSGMVDQEGPPEIKDPFLLQLYKEIDTCLDDAQLGVDYLSRVMAMSRSTLNRKLKALLDTSANDLIRQYRLQKATSYLSAGEDIATVAYKVGFSSHSYFSQCFREQYGMTPSDYVSAGL